MCVIAAKLRGADIIISLSPHEDRARLDQKFGATDVISARDQAAIDQVKQLTANAGADAVLECVGTEQAVLMATQIARPGAVVGRVGIPQKATMDTNALFYQNVGLRGGIASVTTYDCQILLDAVLTKKINPGLVLTKRFIRTNSSCL